MGLILLILILSSCSWKPKPEPQITKIVQVDSVKSEIAKNVWGLPELKVETATSINLKANKLLYAKWMNFFQSEASPLAAYEKLLIELKKAKPDHYSKLFDSFSRCPAFLPMYRNGSEHLEFVNKWVADAIEHKNETIRKYYNDYYYLIKPKAKWSQFYLSNSRLKPGEIIKVHSIPIRRKIGRKKKEVETYRLNLSKLNIDKQGKESFNVITQDTLRIKKSVYRWSNTITEPGVYRISVYNDQFFQEMYFQATWLDVLVTSDPQHLFIWGASFENKVLPPYDVTVFFDSKNKVSLQTDNMGLVGIKREGLDSSRDYQYRLQLKLGQQQVFSEGIWKGDKKIRGPDFFHFQMDQKEYYPNTHLYFFGVKKNGLGLFHEDEEKDSIWLELIDPQGVVRVGYWVNTDPMGFFADSLKLDKSWGTGEYKISLNQIRKIDSVSTKISFGQFTTSVRKFKKKRSSLKIIPRDTLINIGDTTYYTVKTGKIFGGDKINGVFEITYLDSMKSIVNKRIDTTFITPPMGDLKIKFVNEPIGEALIKLKLISYGKEITSPLIFSTNKKMICRIIPNNRNIPSSDSIKGTISCEGKIPGQNEHDSLWVFVEKKIFPIDSQFIRINSKGVGKYSFSKKEKGIYSLTTHYGRNAFMKTKISKVYVYEKETDYWPLDSIKIIWNKNIYTKGDSVEIKVEMNRKSQYLMYNLETENVEKLGTIAVSNGQGKIVLSSDSLWKDGPNLFLAYPGKSKINLKKYKMPYWDTLIYPQIKFKWPNKLKAGSQLEQEISILDTISLSPHLNYQIMLFPLQNNNFTKSDHFQLNNLKLSPQPPTRTYSNFSDPVEVFFTSAAKNKVGKNLRINKEKKSKSLVKAPPLNIENKIKTPAEFLKGTLSGKGANKLIKWRVPKNHAAWLMSLIGDFNGQIFKIQKKFLIEQPLELKISSENKYRIGDRGLIKIQVKNQLRDSSSVNIKINRHVLGEQPNKYWDTLMVLKLKPNRDTSFQWENSFFKSGFYQFNMVWESSGQLGEDSLILMVNDNKVFNPKSYQGKIINTEDKQKYQRLDFDINKNQIGSAKMVLKVSNSLLGFLPDSLFQLDNFSSDELQVNISKLFILNKLTLDTSLIINVVSKDQIKDLALRILSELKLTQGSLGSWSWYGLDSGDVYWSSWYHKGIQIAKKYISDYQWSLDFQEMNLNSIDFLKGTFSTTKNLDKKIHLLYILQEYFGKKEFKKYLILILQDLRYSSTINLFKLLDITNDLEKDSISKEIKDLIFSRSIDIAGEISWGGDMRTSWNSQATEVTGFGLGVLSKWYPEDSTLSKIQKYLIRNQLNSGWGSWKSKAVVFGNLWDYQMKATDNNPIKGKVFYNGEKLRDFQSIDDSLLLFRMEMVTKISENRFVLGLERKGEIFYSSYLKDVDFGQGKKVLKNNVELKRNFRKLEFFQNDSGNWNMKFDSLHSFDVTKNDFIEVKFEVNSNVTWNYISLITTLPPGFTPVREFKSLIKKWNPDSIPNYEGSHKNNQYIIRINQVDRGNNTYRFLIRGKTLGLYTMPPTILFHEIKGNLAKSKSHQFHVIK